MSKNPFEKFADKLLKQDKKGQDLKKYSIDLSGVLGGGIDNKELQYNEHRKLTATAKICLSNHHHFWLAKKTGDHSARLSMIERDIKIASNIIDRINKKSYTEDDITKLKSILSKHGCI
jgi:uncharacterized membrane protein YgaE (UPF0421/DUF939 family)